MGAWTTLLRCAAPWQSGANPHKEPARDVVHLRCGAGPDSADTARRVGCPPSPCAMSEARTELGELGVPAQPCGKRRAWAARQSEALRSTVAFGCRATMSSRPLFPSAGSVS